MKSLGFDQDLTHYDSMFKNADGTLGKEVNYGAMEGKSKDLRGVLELISFGHPSF